MEENRRKWQRNCGKHCGFPMRGVIALVAFFAYVCIYSHRISIAYVIMLDEPNNQTNVENKHWSCQANNNTKPIIRWSMKDFIMPSFFVGYITTHIPGGVLSDFYGAKWVLSVCILLSSLIAVVTPFVNDEHTPGVSICLRMLMGVVQGPINPSINSLLSSWVPKRERATLSTLALSGVPIGLILPGYFSAYSQTNYRGWEISHQVFGSMGLVCFLLVISAISSHPSNHPCIKPEELVFLNDKIKTYEIHSIPWKVIIQNKPVISVMFAQMGSGWNYYLMVTGIPNYLSDTIRVPIMQNGFITCLPFIALFVWTNLSGMLADWVVKTRTMEVGTQRKLYTFLAAVCPGILNVCASYAECREFLAIGFFVISVITNGFYCSGLRLASMDLSQSYAGTIMGIAYSFSSLSGLCCTVVITYLTQNDSIEEWRFVFWLSLFIYIITVLGFVKWGSADVQPFDPSFTA